MKPEAGRMAAHRRRARRAALAAAFALAVSGALSGQEDPVRASLLFSRGSLVPGSSLEAILVLEHAEGWHSYGKDPGGPGLPTSIEWRLPEGLTAGEIAWPEPEPFSSGGFRSSGYSGRAELRIPLSVSRSLKAGGSLRVEAEASWLACKESCVPGLASFSFDLPVGDAPPFDVLGFLLAVLGAFAGGLVLNLMPCVLPVLALKIRALVSAPSSGRTGGFDPGGLAKGAAYGAGVIASFWALAGIIAALKAGGTLVGWGFQFQEPGFIAVMAAFFTVFALSMLGVFEIGFPAAAEARGKGLAKAFLSGAFATVAATPCTAPFMGTAIGYALGSGLLEIFSVFGALGLGLALPVLLLSAFPRLLPRLPKAGRWTETLQGILGFALLATVIWLLSVLVTLSGPGSIVPALASLLGAALAAWIWGRWGGPGNAPGKRLASAIVAAGLFAACVAFSVVMAGKSGLDAESRPATTSTGEGEDRTAGRIPWQPYSEELLARLRAEGSAVFVDFGADWCLSCAVNEATVLASPGLASEFASRGVAALKADWTRSDPEITRALESFGRRGVPLYLLYAPGAERPAILPEILTRGIVVRALEAMGD